MQNWHRTREGHHALTDRIRGILCDLSHLRTRVYCSKILYCYMYEMWVYSTPEVASSLKRFGDPLRSPHFRFFLFLHPSLCTGPNRRTCTPRRHPYRDHKK